MTAPSADARKYRGVEPEQRRAERREQLLQAALELFGTQGYDQTSVRDVCAAAGLNRRYFYESFQTREHLFRAVYDAFLGDLARCVQGAVEGQDKPWAMVELGVHAFWDRATRDRREARILTIESVGISEDQERRRRQVRHTFADFIASHAAAVLHQEGLASRVDLTVVGRALVAATIDLLIDWMREDIDLSATELADATVGLFNAMFRTGTFARPAGSDPPSNVTLDV